jgi:hypothetical protein
MNHAMTNEPGYAVLWPLSRRAVTAGALAPRLADLNGKVVCELWDVIFRGEVIYPAVREYILQRFPDVKFIEYSEFGNFYGAREERDIATWLPALLKARACDAVIVGIGA